MHEAGCGVAFGGGCATNMKTMLRISCGRRAAGLDAFCSARTRCKTATVLRSISSSYGHLSLHFMRNEFERSLTTSAESVNTHRLGGESDESGCCSRWSDWNNGSPGGSGCKSMKEMVETPLRIVQTSLGSSSIGRRTARRGPRRLGRHKRLRIGERWKCQWEIGKTGRMLTRI